MDGRSRMCSAFSTDGQANAVWGFQITGGEGGFCPTPRSSLIHISKGIHLPALLLQPLLVEQHKPVVILCEKPTAKSLTVAF